MKKVQILVRKELLDILRDKKTLVMMVAVPMLLYPLIIIGMALFFSAMYSSKADQVYCIGYEADEKAFGEELERVLEKHRDDLETEIELVPLKEQENCAAWLEITGAETGVMRVTIHYTSASQDSRIGKQAAEELLELYRAELVRQRLEAEGLEESILHPVEYEAEDGATLTESMGMDMGGSIGLMLIATILLGAMYPAIDATAGEKERGTLETLLTLPVTNFQMILSKYISVALFTCVTAILSLLSLGGSVLFLMYGIADVGTLPGLSLTALLGAVPVLTAVLLVTALFCSALCMCFCVFAKSFKEANNYVTPVLLAVMFASMAGMLPTVVLDSRTALIPVVNVSLLVKQLISGHLNLALAGIVIGVNLACSILIIWVLAKLYDSETVLFGEGFGSFRIFQKRSEIQGGTIPAPGDVVMTVAVLFLLILYVGSAASVRLGFWGTGVNQLLILLVPLAVVWYLKTDVRRLFVLRKPDFRMIPGSLILYFGTYLLVLGIGNLFIWLFPLSAQNVEAVFLPMVEQPLWALLLVTAVLPGICEELLFRGFLFGSVREYLIKKGAMSARTAVLWGMLCSSLVFGAFHMSLVKLLPTALLGACFVWILWKSRSIYVTMFLHFFNNSISLLALKYPEAVGRVFPLLTKESLSPTQAGGLLGAGALIAALGLWLLRSSKKKPGALS